MPFDGLIMLLFTYATEVWACAHDGKYLVQIDTFCKRTEMFGYTNKRITISDMIRNRTTPCKYRKFFKHAFISRCLFDFS